jgi:hypothetical protein
MSSVLIPPREFMIKYLKDIYPDLNRVRVVVIGRDAPTNPDKYFYKHPDWPNKFASALYRLLGVENFQRFTEAFVLTDAMRCHVQSEHAPERALSYCSRHLRDELKQFPNLQTVVILGEDTYQQFQINVLNRRADQIESFEEVMKQEGWAEEYVRIPDLRTDAVHIVYSYHPMIGYKRTPPLAAALIPR